MEKEPLVSVIIPTYNRAHLIGETLDSVLAQTYQNWECIVVDDGSSDNTDEIVGEYVKKDSRFKYFHRPDEHLPGGNGARNYGLYAAQGDYVVLFDSDDLMTEDHIQVKYDLITSGDYDFAITRTKYYNYTNEAIDKYYNFTTEDITKENYILQRINWLTLDVVIKSKIAKSVPFNESIKIGQEYNYFSKLMCISDNGIFLNKTVSLRRHHKQSKRTTIAVGKKQYENNAATKWQTFLETKDYINLHCQKVMLNKTYNVVINNKKIPSEIDKKLFWKFILSYFKSNALVKVLYYWICKFTDRLYFLRKLALRV